MMPALCTSGRCSCASYLHLCSCPVLCATYRIARWQLLQALPEGYPVYTEMDDGERETDTEPLATAHCTTKQLSGEWNMCLLQRTQIIWLWIASRRNIATLGKLF